MNFTFGIITAGNNDTILSMVIESIIKQNIPCYEIIIVGNTSISHEYIKRIEFDESIRPNWITRKKNVICEHAMYDNIVLLHDYVVLCDDWYHGFLQFGSDFKVCVTKIKTIDGTRFRDYTIFPADLGEPYVSRALLPYDYPITKNINKLLYISGTYYVIKKKIALEYPLNEHLCWGHGEDTEFSKRLIDHDIIIQCNSYSTVQLQKYKHQCIWEKELTYTECAHIESLSDEEMNRMYHISKLHIKNWVKSCTGIEL
jgi:hypothetical protein